MSSLIHLDYHNDFLNWNLMHNSRLFVLADSHRKLSSGGVIYTIRSKEPGFYYHIHAIIIVRFRRRQEVEGAPGDWPLHPGIDLGHDRENHHGGGSRRSQRECGAPERTWWVWHVPNFGADALRFIETELCRKTVYRYLIKATIPPWRIPLSRGRVYKNRQGWNTSDVGWGLAAFDKKCALFDQWLMNVCCFVRCWKFMRGLDSFYRVLHFLYSR